MAGDTSGIEQEIEKIQRTIKVLDDAIQRLGNAADTVDRELETHADAVAKPNYRRAEQQIRTALIAAIGGRKSLERRLELRRGALERERRASDLDGD